MKLVEMKLPNGYNVVAIEQSKSIIEEIWNSDYYHRHFTIKKDMLVLDLGANLGFYSLYAASKGARVFGYEPEKRNYALLIENIQKNNLQDNISAYNLAVAKDKKYIDIFYQDFKAEFASCMISTSKTYIESIIEGDLIKIQVPCISLKQILDTIDAEKIDVMKIDCEGSELEILESAPESYFTKIHNIIMETHKAYSEKDIFYLVKELGFRIIAYEKLGGIFATGYLYATRDKKAISWAFNKPVAILKSPSVVNINEEINVDAGDSFPTTEKSNVLGFSWFADDNPLNNSSSQIKGLTFDKAGLHTVTLEVSEAGRIDREEKNIFVLEDDYFKHKKFKELTTPARKYFFKFKGNRFFKIPQCSLPRSWIARCIGFSITLLDPKKSWQEEKDFFNFNGSKIALSGKHKVIRLFNIPYNMDIYFSLSFNKKYTITMLFWAEADKEKYEEQPVYLNGQDKYFLKDINLKHICSIKGRQQFVIKNELIPQSWNLKTIVVAFSIKKDDEQKTPLNAYFKCGNIEANLNHFHNEVELPFLEDKSNISFYLEAKEERNIEIMWWLKQ